MPFKDPMKRKEWVKKWLLKNPNYHSEYNKKWVLKNPNYFTIKSNAWKKKNPLKAKAHYIFHNAFQKGLIKKENCFCGESKVEAHHEDYSKPLVVVWLCKTHHIEADKKRRIKES